ncbi:MAG: hypothetical protein WCA35_24325 [Kovacikia sp.]
MKEPNLNAADVHVVINDWEEQNRFIGEAKCYSSKGELRWKIPALCKGVGGPDPNVPSGDTPPGLYLAGELIETQPSEPQATWAAYGKYFIDLVEQEDQENQRGRAGIGWHGGGTGAPDPLAPLQPLLPTLGCVRSHNKDMEEYVVKTLQDVSHNGGKMWITVNQL